MKSKKHLLLAILLTAHLLTGCNGQNKIVTTESPAAPSNTCDNGTSTPTALEDYPDNVIIRDVPGEIQFDFDEALKNIYIANNKVSFPKIVAELGEGFHLQNLPLDNENGCITEGLLYNGQDVANVFLVNCTTNNYDVNSEVAAVSFSNMGDYPEQQGIYKFRIGDKVTKEDIIAFFGQPTSEETNSLYYEQLKPKERYIKFTILYDTMYEGLLNIFVVTKNPFN